MDTLSSGDFRRDIRDIPEDLRDMSKWPRVDYINMPSEKRKKYLRSEKAVTLYFQNSNISIAEICQQTGIARSQLYILTERCISRHPDGLVYGFRALIPSIRTKKYKRRAAVGIRLGESGGKAGLAGAFQQLLERVPAAQRYLEGVVKARGRKAPTTARS